MKKKCLSVLLALCLVLTLLPGMALAEETGAVEKLPDATPGIPQYVVLKEVKNSKDVEVPYFFANGAPITIDAADGGEAGAKITWNGGSLAVPAGTNIFGGSHDNDTAMTTSIVMNGGSVNAIFGGGLHQSHVTEANVVINAGTINYQVAGGGASSMTKYCGCDNGKTWHSGDGKTSPCKVDVVNVTIKDGAVFKGETYSLLQGGGEGISCTGKVNLTIEGGTFSDTYVTAGGSNGYTGDAVLTIKGGTFGAVVQGVNRGTMDSITMNITGGSFKNLFVGGEVSTNSGVNGTYTTAKAEISGAQIEKLGVGSNGTQDTANAEKITEVKVDLTDGTIDNWAAVKTALGEKLVFDAVAKIGETPYATLEEAINAVQANETVTVLKDAAVSKRIDTTTSFTLNLNGHKVSHITGNNFIEVTGSATFTIDGTTEGSQFYGRINLGKSSNNNGSAVLNGGTYSCANDQTVLHINGTCNSSNVTIKNATITSPTDNGIQLNGKGTFSIEDSTITGATAVYIKAGTLTIKNSTLTGTMSPVNYQYWGNGANATGDALVIDACGYPGGNPTVEIESGNFSGTKAAIGYYQYNNNSAVKIEVTGGYFSSDPSAHVAQDYAAVVEGSKYHVVPASELKAEVAAPQADAKVSDTITDTTAKEKAEAVANALKANDTKPEITGIQAAAAAVAQETTVTEDAAKDKLVSEGIMESSDSDGVKVVVIPVIEIEVTGITVDNDTVKSLTLDITPMAQTVATKAENLADIAIKADGVENPNAVSLSKEPMEISAAVTITIPLPAGFVTKVDGKYPPIYINHDKNGTVYTYTATVTDNGQTDGDLKLFATFTNPHGFSEFTLTTENTAVAEIGDIGYDSLQAAVDAVTNGQKIKILKADQSATVNRTVKFNVNPDGKTYTINLGAYCTNKATEKDKYDIVYTPVGGGGVSSYAITVEKASNGSVSASASNASSGRTVTLTVKADQGYVLDTLTVTGRNGQTVAVTKVSSTTYTFVMPAYAVTVKAAFKQGEHECPSAKFADVSPDAWYHEAVDYAVETGLMNGVSDTSFDPNGATSRGMIVTMLWRLEKEPTGAASANFSDVEAGAWYAKAVDWAVANEIVTGYGDGTFGPNDAITREQLASILWRYAKYKNQDVSVGEHTNIQNFADADSVSEYALPAIRWAVGAGIMNGKDGGNLDPQGGASRCETAAMFQRMLAAE